MVKISLKLQKNRSSSHLLHSIRIDLHLIFFIQLFHSFNAWLCKRILLPSFIFFFLRKSCETNMASVAVSNFFSWLLTVDRIHSPPLVFVFNKKELFHRLT